VKALKVIVLCFFLVVGAFLAFGVYVSNTPEGQARAHDRLVIEQCRKHLAQPDMAEDSKRTIIAPTCQRFEDDFRRKWSGEP